MKSHSVDSLPGLASFFACLLSLGACTGALGQEAAVDLGVDASPPVDARGDVDAGPLLATSTGTFTPSTDVISNPERGFYHTSHLLTETDFDSLAQDGTRLIYADVRLDDYRESEIPSSMLTDADAAFGRIRDAGVKIVLRFSYNEGPYPDSEPDASLVWVQSHLHSFGPVLRDNADLIAVMQAGFIGAWGEWHTSTNGLTTPENERAVLEAILAELPVERATQIRTPVAKGDLYGPALTEATAWNGTAAARIGHHNDCFVSSEDDVGTYPSDAIEVWKTYVANETNYVPMGGETCESFPARSDCAPALAEMERLHFTYINDDYHPDVVASWSSGGCRDTMERNLGYRLTLIDAELPVEAVRGSSFMLRVRLRNDGFAAPINPRPVVVDLAAGAQRVSFPLDGEDPRTWLAGHEITLERVITIPADLPAGPVTFALALRDASPRLATDARYSIRTANAGTWDAASGTNILGFR